MSHDKGEAIAQSIIAATSFATRCFLRRGWYGAPHMSRAMPVSLHLSYKAQYAQSALFRPLPHIIDDRFWWSSSGTLFREHHHWLLNLPLDYTHTILIYTSLLHSLLYRRIRGMLIGITHHYHGATYMKVSLRHWYAAIPAYRRYHAAQEYLFAWC